MKIMIFLDYFSPAFRAGGPIRIFEAVARGVIHPDEASIVTQDRDLGEKKPMPDLPYDIWTRYDKANVIYASPGKRGLSMIREFIKAKDADVIHINSVFSRTWTLKLLLLNALGGLGGKRVLISPHGELATAALNHKKWRKMIFLDIAKSLGFFKGLTWVATSEKEMHEINRAIGLKAKVVVVPPPFPKVTPHANYVKKKGELKLIFFARISPMKNIGYLNRIFPKLKGRVVFDIYGPVDDDYKDSWLAIFKNMREKLTGGVVNYKGPISSKQSAETLASYDLFIQPSLTENFGYSILESLAAGTPVLISDRTPWNQIKMARCGNTVSLDAVDSWTEKLQSFIDMDDKEWREWSARATEWATNQKQTARALFNAYAGGSHSALDSERGPGPRMPTGAKTGSEK